MDEKVQLKLSRSPVAIYSRCAEGTLGRKYEV